VAELKDYDIDSSANIDSPPDGWPENMSRSLVNNTGRDMMGAIKRDWEGSATGGGTWRNISQDYDIQFVDVSNFKILLVDQTALYPVGRKIKLDQTTDAWCFVSAVSMSGSDTLITVDDFDATGHDEVDSGVTDTEPSATVFIFNAFGGVAEHGIGKAAFENAIGGEFEVPTALTSTALQLAIDNAASNGNIVLMEEGVYDITDTITVPSGIQIWGRGFPNTILRADAGDLADDVMRFDSSADNIELKGFRIDGEASTQTAGNGINGSAAGAHSRIFIRDVELVDIWGTGILFDGSANTSQVWMENLKFFACGDEFIKMNDPDGLAGSIFLSNIVGVNPGTGGNATTTANGIEIEGRHTAEGIEIHLNVDAANTGAGYVMVALDSGGTGIGAYHSTLTNFSITGDFGATSIVGLKVGGTHNAISNGAIEVRGPSAKPLVVDAETSGAFVTSDIAFSNVIFQNGLSNTVSSDSERILFNGCYFEDQSAQGLQLDSLDTVITGCYFKTQAIGIQAAGGSRDLVISGCVIQDCSNDGISLSSGSSGTIIHGNTFRDITDDGIVIANGATYGPVTPNIFDNVTGENLKITSTSSYVTTYDGADADESISLCDTDGPGSMGPERDVDGMIGRSFPVPPDGNTKYLVNCTVNYDSFSSGTGQARFRVGPAGDLTDPIAATSVTGPAGGPTVFVEFYLTPSVGDVYTLGLYRVSGSDDIWARRDHLEGGAAASFSRAELRILHLGGGT
jgi:hypothetical protein